MVTRDKNKVYHMGFIDNGGRFFEILKENGVDVSFIDCVKDALMNDLINKIIN